MKRLLSLVQYMKQGIVKRITPDTSKMRQMRRMAAVREDFLEEHVDEKFIALHLEAYHDVIKELLYAHLYKEGLYCKTEESLLAFAVKTFPLCSDNKELLITLFTMRQKIHALKAKNIKIFLQENHDVLHEIIHVLKK